MIAAKSQIRDSIGHGNWRRPMTKRLWFASALFFLWAGTASAQDAKTVLQAAQKAMGDVTSIQYSGTGHINSFGQAWTPNAVWPSTNLTSYTKTIDYSSKSAKEELVHSEPNPMVKGGGRPFAGDDKQANFVSGQYAWDMPATPDLAHPARVPEGRDGKQRHREKRSHGNGDFVPDGQVHGDRRD
jgi:hypothetical protein